MRAAWYERTGPARDVIVVAEMPAPAPGAGEVLVRLAASGVNPSDVKARAGTRGGASAMPYPRIVPHGDGAGTVEAVGSEVSGDLVGKRVWLANGQWTRAFGTAAEYIAIDRKLAFPLPDNVPFEVGAALGIPAVTACHAVLGQGPVEGKTVLISGGAGTVGRLAVQFAKLSGAHVIATGRGEEERRRTVGAGADVCFDFTSQGLVDEILAHTGGKPVDHIVEVEYGANAETSAALIAPRGAIVTYGSARLLRPELPFYSLLFKGVRLEFVLVYLLTHDERGRAAARINELLRQGRLDVPVHSRHALAECAAAHEVVESGQRGGAVVVTH